MVLEWETASELLVGTIVYTCQRLFLLVKCHVGKLQ